MYGFVFALGDVNGSFDTTLTVSSLCRLQDPNPELYGLTNYFNGVPGTAFSVNNDDGDLNYRRGIDSFVMMAEHDLQLDWQNWTAFVRGYYFLDPINEWSTPPHTPLSSYGKQKVGADAVLLDSYVTGKFDLDSTPVTVRLGRQVINWGESTFIPNGIDVINPIDVARLRAPGSELREALLPVDAWDTSIALTDKLSLDAVWLLEFRPTQIDPDGTYFSTNDSASPGGSKVYLGFGALSDQQPLGAIPRGPDRGAGELGQWGLAMHYLATELNHTEFGFYFLRYSSRLPVVSAVTATGPVSQQLVVSTATSLAATKLAPAMIAAGYPAAGVPAALQTLIGAALTNVPAAYLPASLQPFYPAAAAIASGAEQLGFLTAADTGSYFDQYPGGINMFGASFNTDLGTTGISLQGEISFKNHVPLQVDDVELLFAALSALDASAGTVYGSNNQVGNFSGQYGTEIQGYRSLNVWQAQTTATKVFGPMLGANQFSLIGEVGVTMVPDLPAKSQLRFDSSAGTATAGSASEMINTGNGAFPATPPGDFADKTSWGYEILGKLDYNNLFAGINVSPLAAFADDVSGNTPLPIGNFLENRKTVTLGVDFVFQNKWDFELRGVYFYGAGAYNLLSDRSYVSATMKYSF
jgi:hypothetical protein